MIGCSVKFKKRHLKVTFVLLVAFFFALFLGIKDNKSGDNVIDVNAKASVSYKVKDNNDRVDFIKYFGWDIEEEPAEVVDIMIPSEFGDVYNNYNEIQKNQGLNLEKYKGKQAKRYSYEIKNYPKEKKYVRANILVYKNKVIGGDICSLKIDGFMHGFSMEE